MTSILILATWLLWVAAAMGLGAGVLTMLRPAWSGRKIWHAGLWLGLGLLLVGSSTLQIMVGLGGDLGRTLATIAIVAGLALGSWAASKQQARFVGSMQHILSWRRIPTLLLILLVLAGLVVMAHLATGEPMDADAGSYRIGAILYAGEERVIPGLANIHFRFGFNSTLWPFGALVGTGLWEGLGYRIVTGVFVTAMVTDMVIRVLRPRATGSRAGDWYMVIAVAFTGGVILTDGGRWIPSPGQDVVFLIVAAASIALLADYVHRPADARWAGGLAIVTAVMAGSIRPLGWVLAVSTVLVVLTYTPRGLQRDWAITWRTLRLPTAFFALTALVMAVRDAVLTGWILYPITAVPLPVAWRAASGEGASMGITAYGRAPGVDASLVLASNDWLAPWVTAFLDSREVFFLRFMVLGALLPLLWAAGRRAWRISLHPLVWAIAPPFLLTATWFVTAPDVRFGWAGLIGVTALPGAFLLAAGAYPRAAAQVLGVLALGAMMGTQFLNGRFEPRGAEHVPVSASLFGLPLTLHLAPPPTPEVTPGVLGDGTPVQFPATGGNCYDIFPLCLLPGTGSDVRRLGETMVDGFGLLTTDR